MLLLLVVIVDEIKEHQTSFEFDGWFTLAVVDVAILFFLFLGGKEEFQATMLVELDKTWLVVGIDNEETATRLVTLAAEPSLYVINNLTAKVQMLIAVVNAEATKQDSRIILAGLLCINLCANHIASPPRDVAGKDTGVGNGNGSDNTLWRTIAEEIGFTKHLPLITLHVVVEEIINVLASAIETFDAFCGDIT